MIREHDLGHPGNRLPSKSDRPDGSYGDGPQTRYPDIGYKNNAPNLAIKDWGSDHRRLPSTADTAKYTWTSSPGSRSGNVYRSVGDDVRAGRRRRNPKNKGGGKPLPGRESASSVRRGAWNFPSGTSGTFASGKQLLLLRRVKNYRKRKRPWSRGGGKTSKVGGHSERRHSRQSLGGDRRGNTYLARISRCVVLSPAIITGVTK
ncbi:uncharacterized protein LOC112452000 isoform X1 [Temnothorax curvispinosus]|uniref:Uncharacterized protein LOC112452000 isoform X1 n=1 Tax=Temnothorax curvispinosus TaxID=300111 RepID=A0A6J1PES1_9HYME|nr:uncharacterized protein LOC112452000 isoform X1 [Temnothorax curvispinosus]XP_024867746.1 uncharacterized protein LOC112452000 isoform X1 [Temnothorax curvispinosus]